MKRLKRQATYSEKIFSNHISNRRLVARTHNTLIKIGKKFFFKLTIPNAGEDAEKLDHSHIAGRNVKWYSYSFVHETNIFVSQDHVFSFIISLIIL